MPDDDANFYPDPEPESMLTSRQQSVVDALAQRQSTKFPLSRWYIGAIALWRTN